MFICRNICNLKMISTSVKDNLFIAYKFGAKNVNKPFMDTELHATADHGVIWRYPSKRTDLPNRKASMDQAFQWTK